VKNDYDLLIDKMRRGSFADLGRKPHTGCEESYVKESSQDKAADVAMQWFLYEVAEGMPVWVCGVSHEAENMWPEE
jgi:hypothetical protein